MDKVEKIEALVPPETRATALYLLALIDIRTLADAPHNVGFLYAQSDVTNSEVYAEFHEARQELVDTYGRFGLQAASPSVAADIEARELGEMLMHHIEVVTTTRNAGRSVTHQGANRIAEAAVRMCGVDEETIRNAATSAVELLSAFHHEDHQ